MSNLYAVTGSTGSGKSTISLLIANTLASKKENTCVISFDKQTPMLNVYEQSVEFAPINSLGKLMSGAITLDNLKERITRSKTNQYLCFLGLVAGDSFSKYPDDFNTNKVIRLIELLNDFGVDNIVFDLASDYLSNKLTAFCLKLSKKSFFVLNPTTSSISFLESNKIEDVTYVLNNFYEYSPYETVQKERTIDILIPHSREIYDAFISSDFRSIKTHIPLEVTNE